MAAKKKKRAQRSEWSWRLAGFALCAFFALGVATGLSGGGHRLEERLTGWWPPTPRIAQAAGVKLNTETPPERTPGAALALVERGDGFYALDSGGGLRGPVAPAAEGDMPILSGPGVAAAGAARLLDDASILVRAEASLGRSVSELRADSDENGVIYLDRPPLPIAIDFARAAVELERANQVLALWQGRRDLLVALDMTVPGQAVVRLRPSALRPLTARVGAAPVSTHRSNRRNFRPEVTASR